MKYNSYLRSNPNITAQQSNKKLVSVFCNLTNKKVELIPIKIYKEIIETLTKVLQEEVNELIPQWNGLGFIPNLDDIKVKEYADLELFYKEDESELDKFLSVLYRPIKQKVGKDYIIEEYNGDIGEHINKIHAMPLDVVSSSIGFFLRLRDELLTCTLNYSKEE